MARSALNSSLYILEKEKRSNSVKTGTKKGRKISQSQVGEHFSRN